MEKVTTWIGGLVSDFMSMSPTAQISWLLAVTGAAIGAIVWISRTLGADKKRSKAQPEAEIGEGAMIRLLALVSDGKATAAEAADLARVMMPLHQASAVTPALALTGTNSVSVGGGQPLAIAAQGSGIEDRRQFVAVVQSLATSKDTADRDVVLKYAKGDVAAALASLEKRAQNAGDKGAPIWREIAALAKPREPKRAIDALRKAIELDRGDVESRLQLSRALWQSGDAENAKKAAEQALSLAPTALLRSRASVLLSAAWSDLSNTAKAREHAEDAVSAGRDAAAAEPENIAAARALASAFMSLSRRQGDQGDSISARQSGEAGLKIYRALYADQPDERETGQELIDGLTIVAVFERQSGDMPSNVAYLEEATALALKLSDADKSDLDMAAAHANAACRLAYAIDTLGDRQRALSLSEDVARRTERVLGADEGNVGAFNTWNWAQILRARILLANGNLRGAIEMTDDSLRRVRERAAKGDATAKRALVVSLQESASIYAPAGEIQRSEDARKEAHALAVAAAAADPSNVERTEDVLLAIEHLAVSASDRGDFEEQRRLTQEAVALARRTTADRPSWATRERLQACLYRHAYALIGQGALIEAMSAAREARELAVQLQAQNTSSAEAKTWLTYTAALVAQVHELSGDLKQAASIASEAYEQACQFAAGSSVGSTYRESLSAIRRRLASVRTQEGNFEDAIRLLAEERDEAQQLATRDPSNKLAAKALSDAEVALGDAFVNASRNQEGMARYEAGLAILRGLPISSDVQMSLVVALARISKVLKERGDANAAKVFDDEMFAVSKSAAESKFNLNAQQNYFLALLDMANARAAEDDLKGVEEIRNDAHALLAHIKELAPEHTFVLDDRVALLSVDAYLARERSTIDEVISKRHEAIALRREMVKRLPESASCRRALANLLIQTSAAVDHKDSKAAMELVRESASILDELARDYPQDDVAQTGAVVGADRMARALKRECQLKEALAYAQRALEVCEAQAAKISGQRHIERNVGAAHTLLADILVALGDMDEALKHGEVSCASTLKYVENEQDKSDAVAIAIRARFTRASLLRNVGRLEESRSEVNEIVALTRSRYAAENTRRTRADLELSLRHLAVQNGAEGRPGDSVPVLVEANEVVQQELAEMTDVDLREGTAADLSIPLIDAYLAAGDLAAADDLCRKSHAVMTRLYEANPNLSNRSGVLVALQRVGDIAYAQGRGEDAVRAYDECLAAARALAADAPQQASFKWDETEFMYRRARALKDRSAMAEVAQRWRALRGRYKYPPPDAWTAELERDIAAL